MTVVPGASVLRCVPVVDEEILRCNRALSNAIDTVHMHCLILPYPVPMDTCTVVTKVIYNIDVDSL